ncbi:hypothetical protein K438DRAFT_1980643 [Mycena galopus ATCC 62051]|nr:hypothetical protein K438DRAFT_1980643 [Mycena galopus ATCC 62051]
MDVNAAKRERALRRDARKLYGYIPNEDTFMTQREAEEYRLELMKERSGLVENCEAECWFTSNKCEH